VTTTPMSRVHLLKGITWDDPRGYAPLIETAEQYASATGVTVTWDRRSLTAFGDESIDHLTRRYDLLVIDHPWVGYAALVQCLVPLDAFLEPDALAALRAGSVGPSFDSYTYGGHQWALPIDGAAQVSAYRPDLMEQCGVSVPSTWPEVFSLAPALASHGMSTATPLSQTDVIPTLLTLLAGRARPRSELRAADLRSRAAFEALEMLARLRDLGDGRGLFLSPPELLDLMASTDEVAYAPLLFGYANYSRRSFRPRRIKFTNIPSAWDGPCGSTLGGAGIAVSARSPAPGAAASYAFWIASPTIQAGAYFRAGGQPAHLQSWRDPNINQATDDFFTGTLPTLEASRVRPRHPGYIRFQITAGRLLHRYLRDRGLSAEGVLERLAQAYAESFQPAVHTLPQITSIRRR
jgi:multiple sugar transport system substrate-binding protein